jgi:hypothetical protein
VATSPQEWQEGQADRILARQRAQADNAKLVATFAAGIAAALAASALEAGSEPSGWDWAAAILLGLTVFATGVVLLLDRVAEPNHKPVMRAADNAANTPTPWSDAYTLYRLRKTAVKTAKKNQKVLWSMKRALWPQLLGALSTTALAAISMLRG